MAEVTKKSKPDAKVGNLAYCENVRKVRVYNLTFHTKRYIYIFHIVQCAFGKLLVGKYS